MTKSKRMAISKARVNLGAVVSGVRDKNDVVVLEKDGIPVASLVSVDTVENLRDAIDMATARLETHKEALVDWADIRRKYV